MDTESPIIALDADLPLIVEYLLLRSEELLANGSLSDADELLVEAECLAGDWS